MLKRLKICRAGKWKSEYNKTKQKTTKIKKLKKNGIAILSK